MVNSVFEYLNKIQQLLEQINGITQNQMTVVLGMKSDLTEEQAALDLIEEMVNCKEDIIGELSEVETDFQKAYDQYREELIKTGRIKQLKEQVASVLELKKMITNREEENKLILQNQSQKKIESIKMQPNSNQVTAAYQKQQIKS